MEVRLRGLGVVLPVPAVRAGRPLQVTLYYLPQRRSAEQEALMQVAAWYERLWPGWARFLIALCAVFHLWTGITVLTAPARQVVNAATVPVFALAPRSVWAVAFVLVGIGAGSLFFRVTLPRTILLWSLLIPLFFSWEGAFVLAVLDDKGSALSVIIWPTLYLPFIAAALRLALRK